MYIKCKLVDVVDGKLLLKIGDNTVAVDKGSTDIRYDVNVGDFVRYEDDLCVVTCIQSNMALVLYEDGTNNAVFIDKLSTVGHTNLLEQMFEEMRNG